MKNFSPFSKLRVENLEERTLLAVMAGGPEMAVQSIAPTGSAVWVVNTLEDSTDWTVDDEVVSLREAIERAETGDTIVFGDSLGGGTITLNGSQLSVNKGVAIDASSIDGITIDANGKSRVFSISGGNESNPVELISLTITGGWTDGDGGGFYFDYGTLTITDSTVSGNTANGHGGGIYNSGTLTLTNTTVLGNTTNSGGGGIYNYISSGYYSLSLINCSIRDNTANASGGGIFYHNSSSYYDLPPFLLTNCIVSGNISHGNGGGVYLDIPDIPNYYLYENEIVKIVNCTIAGNSSDLPGGGIYSHSPLDLYNTIVAENDSGNLGEDIYGFVYGHNSLSSFTNWADAEYYDRPKSSRCIPYDPNRPLFNDSGNEDYSLAKQSQAINRGENSYIDGIAKDITGNQRISDQAVDIGAYEFQWSGNIEHEIPSVVVTTELDIVDDTDGIISLREAIAYALPGETVQFANNLKGRTFKLYDGELLIDKNVSIDATNICGASIDADKRSRVIKVSGGSEDSPVLLIGLMITNGYSKSVGGGLYNEGVLKLINTTIVDNQSAEIGGGIFNNGILTLTNCTVTDNKASENGSGLYNSSGVTYLYNTIVAENGEDESLRDIFNEMGSIYAYNSLSSFLYWTASANCITYDSSKPLFYLPSDYYTSDCDYKIPYCFLCENSQAIDKGNNSYINGYAADIFGMSRILDGSVDIGAHEYIKEAESTIVTTTLDVINPYDNVISLREAIDSYVNDSDLITFDSRLAGGTIMLNGPIYPRQDLNIDASGIGGITLDGNGTQQSEFHEGILWINGDAHIELIGLTLTHGYNSRAGWGGGAICNNGGHLTLTDCCITRSYAANGVGGGIVNFGGEINLINCIVSNNCVGGSSGLQVGGGICNWSGKITLTGCDILENYAPTGGGIYLASNYDTNVNNSVVITNCNISGNRAGCGAGVSSSLPLVMTGCIVSENIAYRGPVSIAGILSSSNLTLINCSITQNKARESLARAYSIGGIYVGGNLEVTNCTIARNEADLPSQKYSTGGVFLEGYANYNFRNSLVVQNTAGGIISDIYSYVNSCVLSMQHTLTSEYGEYFYDPSLPLFTDPDNGDFTLSENSQAINKGNNAYIGPAYDISGNPRIVDDIVDLGAYEYWSHDETPSTVVTTTLDTINGSDNLISLCEAILYARAGDTITFDPTLAGKTIMATGRLLEIDKPITIDASSIGGITIDTEGNRRLFSISGGTEKNPVKLIDLTITGGKSSNGGGIYNSGVLAMTDCTVSGNTASSYYSSYGGGIYNSGILTMTGCTVSGNNVSTDSSSTSNYYQFCGGGIYNSGVLTMTGCVVSGNNADSEGGGIYNYGELTLLNCTIAGNVAHEVGGVYNSSYSPMSVLYNSIISFNHADHGNNDIYHYMYDGCNNITSANPGFKIAPNFDEDGKLTNFDLLDLTLSPESAAIDAGDNSYVTTETDLAGNKRIANGTVDIGAYEYGSSPLTNQLTTPTILTGNKGVYVSYGANRHQIQWGVIDNASGYELQYSTDGSHWTTVSTTDAVAVITGLTYGQDVKYRVRALGTAPHTDSDWSGIKTFNVCPMDVNGDGDISGSDRTILAGAWLAEAGDEAYRPYADVNGDGDISGADRAYISGNWLAEAGDDGLNYPRAAAADVALAEYAPRELDADRDVF